MFIKASVFFFRQGTEGNDTGLLRKILQVLEQAKYLRKEKLRTLRDSPKNMEAEHEPVIFGGEFWGLFIPSLEYGTYMGVSKKIVVPQNG